MGAYSRWALIRGWALINFHNFHQVVSLFCTQKSENNKTGSCCKAEFYLFIERFFKILRHLGLRRSLSLSLRSVSKLSGTSPVYFSFLRGRGWALINFSNIKGGRLFEMGAYLKLGA